MLCDVVLCGPVVLCESHMLGRTEIQLLCSLEQNEQDLEVSSWNAERFWRTFSAFSSKGPPK